VNNDGVLVEYADISSTMGFCCALRCYNAPHSWQLGWLPMLELDGSRLTPGTTISFELARQQEGRGVRVTPNWADGQNPLLISYRGVDGERHHPPCMGAASVFLNQE
jgi:hypothetical protein